MNQNVKFADAQRILRKNGYELTRVTGSHYHYENGANKVIITVRLNPVVWNRLVKENRLVVKR